MTEELLQKLNPSETQAKLIAQSIYIALFQNLDSYHQQEVIVSLVTQIGNGSLREISFSLDTLSKLIIECGASMVAPYCPIIKEIFDYFENFSLNGVKKLYSIFAELLYEVLTMCIYLRC